MWYDGLDEFGTEVWMKFGTDVSLIYLVSFAHQFAPNKQDDDEELFILLRNLSFFLIMTGDKTLKDLVICTVQSTGFVISKRRQRESVRGSISYYTYTLLIICYSALIACAFYTPACLSSLS